MDTISDLFQHLGGPAKVGRMIGVQTPHAALMRRRGSIPEKYWGLIIAQAEDVSLDTLQRLAHKRRIKREAA